MACSHAPPGRSELREHLASQQVASYRHPSLLLPSASVTVPAAASQFILYGGRLDGCDLVAATIIIDERERDPPSAKRAGAAGSPEPDPPIVQPSVGRWS